MAGNAHKRKLTITLEDAVYQGLHKVVGRRYISQFLNDLARPHVVPDALESGYRAMAADEEREAQADEWGEEMIGDLADAPRRKHRTPPRRSEWDGPRSVRRREIKKRLMD